MHVVCLSLIRNLMSQYTIRSLSSLNYGEALLAVDVRKDLDYRKTGHKKLFKLEINGKLKTYGLVPDAYDTIPHSTIAGCSPNDVFTTRKGNHIGVRRPSLEEYVLFMPRKANIMYPKDIWASIGMMDIDSGSKVIEAGSGSGALTLFLSRAGSIIIACRSIHA